MRSVAAVLVATVLHAPGASQDPGGADGEILSIGQKLLGQAKARYDAKEWLEAIDSAERARTAFLALAELAASRKRTDELRMLNEAVAECAQLIRLARDARKADGEKAAPPPPAPNVPAPPKDPTVPAPPARLDPPTEEARERAEKAIREVYREDYAQASGGPAKQALARDILEIRKERDAVRAAEKTLLEKPDHALSALLVGRFVSFMKGDWERGLPLLRKGADPELRKLADAEAAGPGTEGALGLGDGWWAVAEKEPGATAKRTLRARARTWYERALPNLAGFPRTRVLKLLEDLAYEERARWDVDLLKLIDPRKNSVAGEWRKEGPPPRSIGPGASAGQARHRVSRAHRPTPAPGGFDSVHADQ